MDVALPQDDMTDRLPRYLEGFQSRHGLAEAEVEGNAVRLVVEPRIVPAVLTTAREALGIMHLSFITVVDQEGSFGLTYELLDLRGATVRIKTTIEGDEPVIDTVTGIYPTANWHEREAHEMFGIDFLGHPNLAPLYLPDGFIGNPLRKSFPLLTREVKPWPGKVDVEAMPEKPSTENPES